MITTAHQISKGEGMKYTLVFEFEEGKEPAINAGTEFMGGKCVAVQFNDALEELAKAEELIEELHAQLHGAY